LDQGHGTAVAFVGIEPSAISGWRGNSRCTYLQHRRDPLGLRGQQYAQRTAATVPIAAPARAVDQVLCRLRHAPRAASRAETAPLAVEGQQLVVAAFAAAQPQKSEGQDAVLAEGVELRVDEPRQLTAGADLGLGEEAGGVLLHQAVQGGLLRSVALAEERCAVRRPLGLPAEGVHDGHPTRVSPNGLKPCLVLQSPRGAPTDVCLPPRDRLRVRCLGLAGGFRATNSSPWMSRMGRSRAFVACARRIAM
jgi:hypothetical protein